MVVDIAIGLAVLGFVAWVVSGMVRSSRKAAKSGAGACIGCCTSCASCPLARQTAAMESLGSKAAKAQSQEVERTRIGR